MNVTAKNNTTKSVRLFKNEWMEALTHIPVWIPALFWTPVVGYLLYQTALAHSFSALEYVAIAISGILTWTFSEYILHRILFHAEFQSPLLQRMVFLLHGVHHDYPNDSERLLMPPLASVPIATAFWFGFNLMLGAEIALPFFAFFLIGYLFYDYIHYATHHFRLKSALMKTLKANHMAHHYISSELYYGVSSPLWDHIFGTFKD